jgi:hypothetical protein
VTAKEDEDEARRALLAQSIKNVDSSWALEVELIIVKARFAKVKFDALCKAGFSREDALLLCTKTLDL